MLAEHGITRRDVTIPGHRGDEITLSVLGRRGHTGFGPVIYFAHGGGMVTGGRFGGVERLVGWIERFHLMCVTVEYRLAPEFPDPYPVEDCYEGLLWTVEHCEELGIDPARVIVAGASAGGGLAAGIALLARDRGAPSLAGQLLISPMLDDRDATVSTRQIDGVGVWDRTSNLTGWTALLGDRRGTDDVSEYAAPARTTDFSGLPPAYIECGSAEVFRDEDVAFASALWAAGVQAESHVWAGGYHAFDLLAPHAAVSQAATAARDSWLARVLGV
jgi:acetyl esterase/lipase